MHRERGKALGGRRSRRQVPRKAAHKAIHSATGCGLGAAGGAGKVCRGGPSGDEHIPAYRINGNAVHPIVGAAAQVRRLLERRE